MTYACPILEFAADTRLMKLRYLQNKIFRIIGKFPRNAPIRDMRISFQIPYAYGCICRKQAQVIQHHESIHIRNIG
jgi:hypothetical protein